MNEHLDRQPGMYEHDGAVAALVEQQRACIIEQLRTATAASVTLFDSTGDVVHWGISGGDDAEAFLVYAAGHAIRDIAGALNVTPARACTIVLFAITRGVGE